MMKSVLFDIHDGRLPVCGLPTSSTFVKRSEWLISTWFARFTQNTQVGSLTVVTNQYATSCPSGDTRASIAPVPGAGCRSVDRRVEQAAVLAHAPDLGTTARRRSEGHDRSVVGLGRRRVR